jgi:hypothetical protein
MAVRTLRQGLLTGARKRAENPTDDNGRYVKWLSDLCANKCGIE